jgi:hypothetical protein
MRDLGVWVAEFFKLLGGRRLHPLTTQCPICQQMVLLHVNKAGRRHVFAHARPRWQIVRLKATPARFIGLVDAPDETSAIKAAIEQFVIPPADQERLIALRDQ